MKNEAKRFHGALILVAAGIMTATIAASACRAEAGTLMAQSQSESTPALSEEAYGNKYDFIPGDKVMLMDDFSDTEVGEFPRKWTLKGPGGGGNAVEVIRFSGKNWLHSVPVAPDVNQENSVQYVRLTKAGNDLPQKFTLEFDAVLGTDQENHQKIYTILLLNEEHSENKIEITGIHAASANTESSFSKSDDKVHHIAVSVNGTFVKAYVDNERVINDPEGVVRPVQYVGIVMGSEAHYTQKDLMFTNFRLAEGGKEIKAALVSGKIITHGILFDPGSDKIRPESVATLRQILELLKGDPSLKFSIEGHTDNQGDPSTSQPLSEKRATAIKNWLVNKGITADRLKTKGWGESKPIDTNETPEGRANNRRVEFVKI